MSYAFIGGIPASGKSYLAEKVAAATGAQHIALDQTRIAMLEDPGLKRWVNFLLDQNEALYWSSVTPQVHWDNLCRQSEAFWPTFEEKIKQTMAAFPSAIFEAVNLLPHLTSKLPFSGIYLLGESQDVISERNRKNPRWGATQELQDKEAEVFYVWEGQFYKQEAEKFGFEVFSSATDAEKTLLRLMKN